MTLDELRARIDFIKADYYSTPGGPPNEISIVGFCADTLIRHGAYDRDAVANAIVELLDEYHQQD